MTAHTIDSGEAPLSELFEILSHEYRRRILLELAHLDTRADAQVETARFTEFDDEPDVLRLSLCHNHFPKLDDHGFVDWDPEAETLTRGPRFGEIEPFLALMSEHENTIPQNWP